MHVIECIERGELPHLHVKSIITDRHDAPVRAKCQQRGIRCELIDPALYVNRKAFDAALYERVRMLEPDLVGLVGYLRIIRGPLLDWWSGRLFNLHPSLLPSYPGLDAVARAYAAGKRRLGATLHHVDAGIDTGPVIAQLAVQIPPTTLDAAINAVHRTEAVILQRTLAAFDRISGFPSSTLSWPDLILTTETTRKNVGCL